MVCNLQLFEMVSNSELKPVEGEPLKIKFTLRQLLKMLE